MEKFTSSTTYRGSIFLDPVANLFGEIVRSTSITINARMYTEDPVIKHVIYDKQWFVENALVVVSRCFVDRPYDIKKEIKNTATIIGKPDQIPFITFTDEFGVKPDEHDTTVDVSDVCETVPPTRNFSLFLEAPSVIEEKYIWAFGNSSYNELTHDVMTEEEVKELIRNRVRINLTHLSYCKLPYTKQIVETPSKPIHIMTVYGYAPYLDFHKHING